jgi:hypothetical protein
LEEKNIFIKYIACLEKLPVVCRPDPQTESQVAPALEPPRVAVLHVFLGSDVGNLQDLIQFIFAGLTGGAI